MPSQEIARASCTSTQTGSVIPPRFLPTRRSTFPRLRHPQLQSVTLHLPSCPFPAGGRHLHIPLLDPARDKKGLHINDYVVSYRKLLGLVPISRNLISVTRSAWNANPRVFSDTSIPSCFTKVRRNSGR